MPHYETDSIDPSVPDDPTVIFIGDSAAGPEFAQLDLACRFYGFRLIVASSRSENDPILPPVTANAPFPILVVVHASKLADFSHARWHALLTLSDRHRIPIAVLGITSSCDQESLAQFAIGAAICATPADPSCGVWVTAADPASTGFELRGLRLALGSGVVYQFECSSEIPAQVLATIGQNEPASRPAILRVMQDGTVRYLLVRTAAGKPGAPWQFRRSYFGEFVPMLLLLRDAGGNRCWHPPAALANLTIDDPWLTEPYGCLSFTGLLAQMRRERFHATIGFVPWNYDRNSPDVVALFHANPEHFSIAVHGNNHDRYEFFRYEARPDDHQRSKPLAEQAFNIRQALARMDVFHRCTGLDFDRVMVFPHGVCPAPTFSLLKQHGFWATSNYSNVPLDERPPSDPVVGLRSPNTDWDGFPALRRLYPQNYSEEAIAIDLFLGNPILFMAHQDLFFDGIDAFTPFARRVNQRQPTVRWTSLGGISRQLHLLRWLDGSHCDVRLNSRHAKIDNPRSVPVEFRFAKREPDPEIVDRITVDGVETAWSYLADAIHFVAVLPPGATCLIEVHYHSPSDGKPVSVRRRGFRNRSLRLLADFRDLTLSKSFVGRFLARKYYRPGKRRPTVKGLVSRLTNSLRSDRPGVPHSDPNSRSMLPGDPV